MKKLILPLLLFISLLSFPSNTLAVCPVCTIAVAGGIGISRYLGIDDTVTGLWIGALIVSSSLWFINWYKKKFNAFRYLKIITFVSFYVLFLVPLYFSGLIGHKANQVLGIDKILFGTILGSLLFTFSVWIDRYLRSKNEGKVYIYYQKVIVPVLLLSFSSLLLVLLQL
jgi:hypothetical protein